MRRIGRRERARRFVDVRGRAPGVVFLVLLLGLWQWAGTRASDYVFAPPGDVVSAASSLIRDGELGHAVATTLLPLAIGFAVAALAGVAIGFAMGWSRAIGRILNPYVSALYVTPMVALVPLIVIWVGFGLVARSLVVAVFCLFEIMLSAYGGVRALDQGLVDVARTFGASPVQLVRRIVFPGALPSVLVGLRIGVSRAIAGIVLADALFPSEGLGGLLRRTAGEFDAARMLAVVATIAVLGIVLAALLQVVERRVLRWRPAVQRGVLA